jgi:ethanolamine-phosphate phospho-lyase
MLSTICLWFTFKYGGNPVSCAVGNAVLDCLEKDNLVQHAAEVGKVFLEKLETLKTKHKLIGDVRWVI